jgi:hypothetical protein
MKARGGVSGLSGETRGSPRPAYGRHCSMTSTTSGSMSCWLSQQLAMTFPTSFFVPPRPCLTAPNCRHTVHVSSMRRRSRPLVPMAALLPTAPRSPSCCHPRELVTEFWGFSRGPVGITAVWCSWGPKPILTAVLRGLPQHFALWLGHGLDKRIHGSIPDSSLLQIGHTGTGADPATYSMGTRGEAAVIWSWLLTVI